MNLISICSELLSLPSLQINRTENYYSSILTIQCINQVYSVCKVKNVAAGKNIKYLLKKTCSFIMMQVFLARPFVTT